MASSEWRTEGNGSIDFLPFAIRYSPFAWSLMTDHHPLIVPHLHRHGQAREGGRGRRAIGRDAEEAEYHDELAHVLAGMPRRALEIVVQGHVAVIDARLAGEVGG